MTIVEVTVDPDQFVEGHTEMGVTIQVALDEGEQFEKLERDVAADAGRRVFDKKCECERADNNVVYVNLVARCQNASRYKELRSIGQGMAGRLRKRIAQP